MERRVPVAVDVRRRIEGRESLGKGRDAPLVPPPPPPPSETHCSEAWCRVGTDDSAWRSVRYQSRHVSKPKALATSGSISRPSDTAPVFGSTTPAPTVTGWPVSNDFLYALSKRVRRRLDAVVSLAALSPLGLAAVVTSRASTKTGTASCAALVAPPSRSSAPSSASLVGVITR